MNFANRDHDRNRALCIVKDVFGKQERPSPIGMAPVSPGATPPHGLGAPSQLPTCGNFLETKHSNVNILKKYLILSLIEGFCPFFHSQ